MNSGIRHVVSYPQPPHAVWRALTTRELLSDWLMATPDFEPVVGRPFRFQAPRMPGWDGVIRCAIVELVPVSRMVWTWQGTNMRQPTRVEFRLEADGTGTRLTLEHTGFHGLGGWMLGRMHRAGWKGKFLEQRLRNVLAAGQREVR